MWSSRVVVGSLACVAVAACGGGADGADGAAGAAGGDGLASLAVVTNEPPGANCPAGGLLIQTGVDDNSNGTLEADEVDSEVYACNGADGVDGDRCTIEKNGRCVDGDLRGVDLTGRDLSGIDLSGADLSWAILDRTDFSGANLTGAVFDNARGSGSPGDILDFRNAAMTSASFDDSRLSCVSFHSASLTAATFDGAIISNDVCGSEYVGFTGADLTGASFVGARLLGAYDPTTGTFAFDHAIASGADFSDATLWHVIVEGTVFDNASFQRASLRHWTMAIPPPATPTPSFSVTNANFSFATLVAIPLAGTNASSANAGLFDNTYHVTGVGATSVPGGFTWPASAIDMNAAAQTGKDWSECDIKAWTTYDGVGIDAMSGHDFSGASAQTAGNLSGRDLSGLDLHGGNYVFANLEGANLSGALLSETASTRANFSSANLQDTDLRFIDLDGTDNGATGRVSFFGADLRGAWLNDTDLRRADFTAAVMSGSTLIGADLSGASFNGSTVWAATGERPGAFYSVGTEWPASPPAGTVLIDPASDYAGSNLSRLTLSIDISTAGTIDFTGADFTGATFSDGIDIAGSLFQQASFTGATLHCVVMSDRAGATQFDGADFTGANLTGAKMDAGRFAGANFAGADLTGARTGLVDQSPDTPVFTGATFTNAVCPDGVGAEIDPSSTCIGHDIDPLTWSCP
jgi:uncharacterized protein YjbI with pentapeptide repeats